MCGHLHGQGQPKRCFFHGNTYCQIVTQIQEPLGIWTIRPKDNRKGDIQGETDFSVWLSRCPSKLLDRLKGAFRLAYMPSGLWNRSEWSRCAFEQKIIAPETYLLIALKSTRYKSNRYRTKKSCSSCPAGCWQFVWPVLYLKFSIGEKWNYRSWI